jgi:hypothetical protein
LPAGGNATPAPAPAPTAASPAAGASPADAAPAAAPAKPRDALDPKMDPAEAAAWAQIGCTLLNLEAAIRRG